MGKNRHKINEEELQTYLIQKEERELDEDEYEVWLEEVEDAQQD